MERRSSVLNAVLVVLLYKYYPRYLQLSTLSLYSGCRVPLTAQHLLCSPSGLVEPCGVAPLTRSFEGGEG